ncbi:hypothetical protein HPB48_001265 [Haemaphysalis longicornis]|uniref:Ig-like domain-containing protein n=1 Tax=Haemaphysalis longicornis TaxID=44386 RepID=A0A9J6F8U5_HAELO|nr:hypothetical protein HPB48_001265 [Haemaphysalis longicornis]
MYGNSNHAACGSCVHGAALLAVEVLGSCARFCPICADDPALEEEEPPSYVGQEGGQVELPCVALRGASGATASPVRVEWHRRGDPHPEPVYAVHFAGRANLMQGRHQPRRDWAPRAYFALLGSPAALKVKALGLPDAGLYICRVTRADGHIQASAVRLSVLGEGSFGFPFSSL